MVFSLRSITAARAVDNLNALVIHANAVKTGSEHTNNLVSLSKSFRVLHIMMICTTAKLESLTRTGMKHNCTRQADQGFYLWFRLSRSEPYTDSLGAVGPNPTLVV
jgi:hypothetical protein